MGIDFYPHSWNISAYWTYEWIDEYILALHIQVNGAMYRIVIHEKLKKKSLTSISYCISNAPD